MKRGTMMYTGGTQHLDLPQWVGTDKPEMDDFNYAFASIDTELNRMAKIAPEMHRVTFRGKNLGNVLTGAQKANIENGTFEDLFLGDYWIINGVTWRIADFDYWYNCGDTSFTKHHLVIMPDTVLYNAQMNETNTTAGGYVGSKMYTDNISNAKTQVASAFGNGILTHREYLTNAVTSGYPSAGAWYDSTLELPNELMIYGSYIFAPGSTNTQLPVRYTTSKSQLALFSISPRFINNRMDYWLADVVSSTYFARVDYRGQAACNNASIAYGVRPVFPIG